MNTVASEKFKIQNNVTFKLEQNGLKILLELCHNRTRVVAQFDLSLAQQ